MKKQIRIKHQDYIVEAETTPETWENKGRQDIADTMRQAGQKAFYDIRRPKGQVHYAVVEYTGGYFGSVISLGR